jgi:hypothetical protein
LNKVAEFVAQEGYVPLAWAGATKEMHYLNWGDAMSPVMVALMCGLPIQRVPTRSHSIRMGAVGTIGHGFGLGTTFFWGTGSSEWRNPSAPMAERERFEPSPNMTVCATRGPLSAHILSGGTLDRGAVPFGDPVWLLPRFYRPAVEKTHELGIILHLSELNGRALDANASEAVIRAHIPEALQGSIKTINTLTAIDPEGLRAKTDEILACKRIVSTSLHGMVVAESYGIPCLYFATRASQPGVRGFSVEPLDHEFLDLRIRDLYSAMGLRKLPMYVQPRDKPTDFDALISAIDAHWMPREIEEDALMEAFPVPGTPLDFSNGGDMWRHPAISGIQFQHDVAALRRADAERYKAR